MLNPWLLRQQRIHLTRYPVGPVLTGLIDRFWAVRWDIPTATVHSQQVLTHPGANFSVGNAGVNETGTALGPVEARLNGVARTLATRVLAERGWTVAALTTPGGLGVFVTDPATYNDRVVPLTEALDTDDSELVEKISGQPNEESRVGVLARVLESVIAAADQSRVRRAREVAEVARLAESDRTVRRLGDLCSKSGVAPRSLQRMFMEYAGVSPTWVLRRYRLLDAAEEVREGQRVSWAKVAADLGYADQAHLTRDFRSAIGQTPAAYAESQVPGEDQLGWSGRSGMPIDATTGGPTEAGRMVGPGAGTPLT